MRLPMITTSHILGSCKCEKGMKPKPSCDGRKVLGIGASVMITSIAFDLDRGEILPGGALARVSFSISSNSIMDQIENAKKADARAMKMANFLCSKDCHFEPKNTYIFHKIPIPIYLEVLGWLPGWILLTSNVDDDQMNLDPADANGP